MVNLSRQTQSQTWDQDFMNQLTKHSGNRIFHDGDSYFEALLERIALAQQKIYFESYIFEMDVLGKSVLDALAAAAQRDVEVKLMIDGIGSSQWTSNDLARTMARGIQIRVFHPLPWQRKAPNARKRKFAGRWIDRINRRNHRKICIIDDQIAFVGSMNVEASHCRKYVGDEAWRDTSIMIQGPEVQTWTPHLELAWNRTRFRRPSVGSARIEGRLRLNFLRQDRRTHLEDRNQRIIDASHRVWLASPYFVPSPSLLRALRFAAWLGNDVRLLLPRKNDVIFMRWVNRAYYAILLQSGVQIYEYLPSMLHAKVALIDRWALVGSSNLNHRSIFHDLEADVVIEDSAGLEEIRQQFEIDFSKSQRIRARDWFSQNPIVKFFSRIWARLILSLKYWI